MVNIATKKLVTLEKQILPEKKLRVDFNFCPMMNTDISIMDGHIVNRLKKRYKKIEDKRINIIKHTPYDDLIGSLVPPCFTEANLTNLNVKPEQINLNHYNAYLVWNNLYRPVKTSDLKQLKALLIHYLANRRMSDNLKLLLLYSKYSSQDIAKKANVDINVIKDVKNHKVKISQIPLSIAEKLEQFYNKSPLRDYDNDEKYGDLAIFKGLNDNNTLKKYIAYDRKLCAKYHPKEAKQFLKTHNWNPITDSIGEN